MLRLRPEQLASLGADLRTRFVSELAVALRADAGRCEAAVARAESYGITWRGGLREFVRAAVEYGDDFTADAEVAAILGDETIDANVRIFVAAGALRRRDRV